MIHIFVLSNSFSGKTMEVYLPFTQSLWYKMGVLPEPGSGPSAEEMEKGFLTLTGCLVWVQRVRSGHSIIIHIHTIPYAQCMEYLPTFTQQMAQM